jgi:preprotein translocase subunit Sec61beta
MKERLLREASRGLDSDQKQPNLVLYVIVAVAILVLLGGQGILY